MRIIVRLSQKKMPLSLAVMCFCFVGMPASSRPVGGPMVLISMVLAGQFLFTCTLQEVCWPSCGLLLQTSFDMPTLPCEFLCLLMIHPTVLTYSSVKFLCSGGLCVSVADTHSSTSSESQLRGGWRSGRRMFP